MGQARLLSAIGVALLLLGACGAPRTVSPDEVEGPYAWGSLEGVRKVRHLWFAGQPDREALAAAKAAGIRTVIDLRAPDESDFDGAGAASELGLAYYNVPVPGPEPFQQEAFAEIEDLVRKHHDQDVLIHCASGNRAAGWLAAHLVREHGMEVDAALAVGRKAGITKDEIADKVRAFVAGP